MKLYERLKCNIGVTLCCRIFNKWFLLPDNRSFACNWLLLPKETPTPPPEEFLEVYNISVSFQFSYSSPISTAIVWLQALSNKQNHFCKNFSATTVESWFLEPLRETKIGLKNREFEKLKVAQNHAWFTRYCLKTSGKPNKCYGDLGRF